ncbi:hypothetical protein B7463_g8351, partial [Scytalidium lignicola]
MKKSASTWKDRPRWTKRVQESLIHTVGKTAAIKPVNKVVKKLFGMVEVDIKSLVCSACLNHPAGKTRGVRFEKSVEELKEGVKDECAVCCIAFNVLSQFQGDDFRIEDVTSVNITPYLNEIHHSGWFTLEINCEEDEEEETTSSDDEVNVISSNESNSTDDDFSVDMFRGWRPPGWRHLQRRIQRRRSRSSSLKYDESSSGSGSSVNSSQAAERVDSYSDDDDTSSYNGPPSKSDVLISGFPWGRNVSSDPLSGPGLETILDWIRNCATSHPNCFPPSQMQLPTRLLDVGEGNTSLIKIVNVQNIQMPSSREYLKYAALTHCWGGYIPQSTTKDKLKGREIQFSEEELPANFRDAIKVTRALQLRYIWIDSLCIVQDDNDDWATESMKMADIYRGSFIVISATRSPSSTTGFVGPGGRYETVLLRQIDGKQMIVNAHRTMTKTPFATTSGASVQDRAQRHGFHDLWSSVVDSYSQFDLPSKPTASQRLVASPARSRHPKSIRAVTSPACGSVVFSRNWPGTRTVQLLDPRNTLLLLSRGRRSGQPFNGGVKYCRLVDGHCELDTRDPFGRLREGSSITLQGTLHKLDSARFNPKRKWTGYEYPADSREGRRLRFTLDLRKDVDQVVELLSNLYFFALFKWDEKFHALVLQETETKGVFKRVGIAKHNSTRRNWFEVQLDNEPPVRELITIQNALI